MSAAHYVFAGGGTGGHLFPGLAVADALRRSEPDVAITFCTTTRPLDRELLQPTPYGQITQPVRPLTLKPWGWPAFWRAWRRSVSAARTFLKKARPRAVLGLGGYAAGPPVVAARALGIRTAILNPDAIPGRANRFLARRVDLVALQWDASRSRFPAGVNCQTLGCPIRAEFAGADRTEGRRRFELDQDRPTLLVTGASQGSRSVNETIRAVWPEFAAEHPEWQLLHLTGSAAEPCETGQGEAESSPNPTLPQPLPGREGGSAGRSKPRSTMPPIVRVVAFTHEMPAALAAADLVVARAGASTLAELTALGKPSVLLPYPYHRDQHQRVNAEVLADAGAAVLVEDKRSAPANHAPVLAALKRLADEPTRARMAKAARALGRLKAADDVAAWLRG